MTKGKKVSTNENPSICAVDTVQRHPATEIENLAISSSTSDGCFIHHKHVKQRIDLETWLDKFHSVKRGDQRRFLSKYILMGVNGRSRNEVLMELQRRISTVRFGMRVIKIIMSMDSESSRTLVARKALTKWSSEARTVTSEIEKKWTPLHYHLYKVLKEQKDI